METKFDQFVRKIAKLINPLNLTASYEIDTDKGQFIARVSDGTKITGCPSSRKMTVCFGAHGSRKALVEI